jgi:hypothetical protein
MNNLFFEFGKSGLLTSSFPELIRVSKLIRDKNLKVEIQGHTDDIGSDETKSELVFDVSLRDGKTKLFSTPVGAQQISVDGTGKLYISAVDGTNQLVFQQSFGSWVQVASGIGGFFSD